MRVALLQDYARRFFPATKYLEYALRVEQYTLTKAANLVLNVDGCIGTLFLDLLHSSSMFSPVSNETLRATAVFLIFIASHAWLTPCQVLLLRSGDSVTMISLHGFTS